MVLLVLTCIRRVCIWLASSLNDMGLYSENLSLKKKKEGRRGGGEEGEEGEERGRGKEKHGNLNIHMCGEL